MSSIRIPVSALIQRFRLLALLAMLSLASGITSAQTSYQGMWWVQAESGWALNVAHQGDVLAVAWYTYDTNGKPLWLIVSAAKQGDGSYAGDLFRTTGLPFAQINGGSALTGTTKIGTATLRFPTDNTLTLGYTVSGVTQQKNMTRYNFSATPPTCSFSTGSLATATNFTDLWSIPGESGWGINLTHQDDIIVAAWYTYGADGQPMWLLAAPSKQGDGSFSGPVFRAPAGTPMLQINGTPALPAGTIQTVGSIVLRFTDGEHGSMNFTLDNVTQAKELQRFAFTSPRSVCRAVTGGGGNPGNGDSCYPPYTVGDRSMFRSTTQLGAQPQVTDQSSEHVTGTSTFNGHPVYVIEQRDAQGRATVRNYTEQTATEFVLWGADTIDPATGIKNGSVTYVPEFRSPRSLTMNQAVTKTFDTVTAVTVQGFSYTSTDRHQHTVKLIANENVTVPAGTFNNVCKIDIVDVITPQATGTPITVNTLNWTTSSIGDVKSVSTTPTSFGTSNTTVELISASVNGTVKP